MKLLVVVFACLAAFVNAAVLYGPYHDGRQWHGERLAESQWHGEEHHGHDHDGHDEEKRHDRDDHDEGNWYWGGTHEHQWHGHDNHDEGKRHDHGDIHDGKWYWGDIDKHQWRDHDDHHDEKWYWGEIDEHQSHDHDDNDERKWHGLSNGIGLHRYGQWHGEGLKESQWHGDHKGHRHGEGLWQKKWLGHHYTGLIPAVAHASVIGPAYYWDHWYPTAHSTVRVWQSIAPGRTGLLHHKW